jgi:hypothetical protein
VSHESYFADTVMSLFFSRVGSSHLEVSAMLHSIAERLNFESKDKKYDANQLELQQLNGQPLDREAALAAYGLGSDLVLISVLISSIVVCIL